jgi:preprotein translocase subunit Sec61beta
MDFRYHDRHHDRDLHDRVAIDPDSIIDHGYMFGFLAIAAKLLARFAK